MIVHEFDWNGWHVEVHYDDLAENPRKWDGNLGYMRTRDRRDAGQVWEDIPEKEA